jgi:hypothetical protein
VVGALDNQRSRPAEELIAMTHPRAAKGRFIRRTTPIRRAVPPVSWPLQRHELRQPLNGRPTSILIAALDDLPVMRMTVPAVDDPAVAKRARWAQNSARRHRRRALGDCSDDHPDVAVFARVRLGWLAPASIEQDVDGP